MTGEPDAEARARSAFRRQAAACRALGSPFTGWLCERLGEALNKETALGRRVLGWPGDPSPAGDSVPLRLCGGLHFLALSEEPRTLAAAYAAAEPGDAAWGAVAAALREREAELLVAMESPPQTNETARAALVWPALSEVARRTGLPLSLMEVGASAGLNLRLDHFDYRLGEWRTGEAGSALQLAPEWRGRPFKGSEPRIVERSGCDLRPVDLADPEARRRLLSYVWADQAERLARMRAAIDIALAHPAEVERADAVEWLRARLAGRREGVARVVFSTIAWQYLPEARREEGARLIRGAGARADDRSPLAWVRFEADGATPGAALTLELYPGGAETVLARGDFHGRWVDWRG